MKISIFISAPLIDQVQFTSHIRYQQQFFRPFSLLIVLLLFEKITLIE